MGSQCDVASFVLRFKQHIRPDSAGVPQVEWRGHIRHVQHDGEKCFTELHEAIEFIQTVLAGIGPGLACADGTGSDMEIDTDTETDAVTIIGHSSRESGQPPISPGA